MQKFYQLLPRRVKSDRLLGVGARTSLSCGQRPDKRGRGYLQRILMLTLLAPDIVGAIMDRRQPAELGVYVLREGFSVDWGSKEFC